MISLGAAFFLVVAVVGVAAFSGRSRGGMSMNFFQGLFGPKVKASASHILIKGPEGPSKLEQLKTQINGASDVSRAFSDAAFQYVMR